MTIKKIIIAGLVGMALASAAMADQIQIGYSGSGYGPYQTGLGGEFTVNPITPAGWLDLSGYVNGQTGNIGTSGTFETFCVEGSEVIYPYNATYNAVINQNAVQGGVGPAGDPLSVGTGWLYRQFATTTWDSGLSYNYGANRKTSAGALQNAIWWLEVEEGIAYNSGNIYMKAVVDKFGTEAGAKADGGWTYGVYALNLTVPGTGALAQDQLYFVPDSGTTIMLLGIGLGGMALVARRRRS